MIQWAYHPCCNRARFRKSFCITNINHQHNTAFTQVHRVPGNVFTNSFITPPSVLYEGLVHDCGNSSANAPESPQSCTKPFIHSGMSYLECYVGIFMHAKDLWGVNERQHLDVISVFFQWVIHGSKVNSWNRTKKVIRKAHLWHDMEQTRL